MNEVHRYAREIVFKQIIALKIDLASQREVIADDGHALANSFGMQFIETSAKHSDNSSLAMELLAVAVMEKLFSPVVLTLQSVAAAEVRVATLAGQVFSVTVGIGDATTARSLPASANRMASKRSS